MSVVGWRWVWVRRVGKLASAFAVDSGLLSRIKLVLSATGGWSQDCHSGWKVKLGTDTIHLVWPGRFRGEVFLFVSFHISTGTFKKYRYEKRLLWLIVSTVRLTFHFNMTTFSRLTFSISWKRNSRWLPKTKYTPDTIVTFMLVLWLFNSTLNALYMFMTYLYSCLHLWLFWLHLFSNCKTDKELSRFFTIFSLNNSVLFATI